MNIPEAAHKWVNEFNIVPHGILAKLLLNDPDELREVTPVTVGDTVYTAEGCEGEVLAIEDGTARIQTNDGAILEADTDELEIERYDVLPIWGTLWSFSDRLDSKWLEAHLQEMAACGFRIYEQEDYGYVFGIDGAGYDFYEEHWIPLYLARGFRWHAAGA